MSKQVIIKTQYNLASVVNLVEKTYSPQSLVKGLDEIEREYIRRILDDPDICGPLSWVNEHRYMLQDIREAIRQMFEEEDKKDRLV